MLAELCWQIPDRSWFDRLTTSGLSFRSPLGRRAKAKPEPSSKGERGTERSARAAAQGRGTRLFLALRPVAGNHSAMELADAVARAALENARWCDRVCRAHGAPGELHEAYWMDRHRVPPFHPRLVTLAGPSRAAVQLEAVRALVAHDPGSALAVKDSFSALDLAPLGFRRLFEAAWIVWPSGQAAPEPGGPIRWRALRYASELDGWEEAWRGTAPPAELAGIRMFPAELLDAPDVQFIAGEREGRVVATGILHASDGVVGLSNLSGAVGPALRACVAAARAWRPGLPVVGYEHGDELQAAEAAGFERAATLVVWGRAAWGAGTARGATER